MSLRKETWQRALVVVLLAVLVALELRDPSGLERSSYPRPAQVERARDLRRTFDEDVIDFFMSVGFRDEGHRHRVRKWAESLRIRVHGEPAPEDRSHFQQTIATLASVLDSKRIELSEEDPNLDVYFLPSARLPGYEPHYVAGSPGSYWCWWSRLGEIYRCRIVLATDLTTIESRSRLARRYLLRALGLFGRPGGQAHTVLADGRASGSHLSRLDRQALRLLYRPEIYAGMTRRTARILLSGRNRS